MPASKAGGVPAYARRCSQRSSNESAAWDRAARESGNSAERNYPGPSQRLPVALVIHDDVATASTRLLCRQTQRAQIYASCSHSGIVQQTPTTIDLSLIHILT